LADWLYGFNGRAPFACQKIIPVSLCVGIYSQRGSPLLRYRLSEPQRGLSVYTIHFLLTKNNVYL